MVSTLNLSALEGFSNDICHLQMRLYMRNLCLLPGIMRSPILFIIGYLLLFSCQSEAERIQAKRTTITESVYSSAILQPDSLYNAFAVVNGILDQNLVEEGDVVVVGTAIAQIINSNPKLTLENARLAYQQAQQNYSGKAAILRSIQDEIDASRLRLFNDSINYFRQQRLWDSKIGSKAEYDAKKLTFELSTNSLDLLLKKYERTQIELKILMEQAKNNLSTAFLNTKDFTINSKINGKVYALYKEPGEIISPMEPIASLGSAKNYVVKLLVDEVDIVRVKLNQIVLLNLDAYKDKIFEARISKIYPKKDERNQTFLIEALFTERPETLYPGLSGEANIVIATKTNVLTIPRDYLIDGNKLNTESGIVEVQLGIGNMEMVEVLSGITPDTWIIKNEK